MTVLRSAATWLCAAALAVSLALFGLAMSLSNTILNADFVIAQMEDVPVHDFFADEARRLVPAGGEFLLPLIDEAAADLEPWAREQAALVVRAVEDYLGGAEVIQATISVEEPKRYLAVQLEELLLGDVEIMPGLNQLNEVMRRSILDQVLREVDSRIPDTVQLTESYFDAATLSSLRSAREFAGYMRTALWLLPLLALLLVLLIAWLQSWRGRVIARFTGAALLLAGAGSLIVRSTAPGALAGMLPAGMPSPVAAILPAVLERCFQPMLLYGVVLGVVGAALLLVSLMYRTAAT